MNLPGIVKYPLYLGISAAVTFGTLQVMNQYDHLTDSWLRKNDVAMRLIDNKNPNLDDALESVQRYSQQTGVDTTGVEALIVSYQAMSSPVPEFVQKDARIRIGRAMLDTPQTLEIYAARGTAFAGLMGASSSLAFLVASLAAATAHARRAIRTLHSEFYPSLIA